MDLSPETIEFLIWLDQSIWRYPIAAIYLIVWTIGGLKIWNGTIRFIDSLPEDDYPTPEPEQIDGYDSLSDEQQEVLEDVLEEFPAGQVVTPREIKRKVFEDSNRSINQESASEWWENDVKPHVKAHPEIHQLNKTERRWKYKEESGS